MAREVHTRENPGRAPVIFRNHERCTPKLILGIGKKGAALGGKGWLGATLHVIHLGHVEASRETALPHPGGVCPSYTYYTYDT